MSSKENNITIFVNRYSSISAERIKVRCRLDSKKIALFGTCYLAIWCDPSQNDIEWIPMHKIARNGFECIWNVPETLAEVRKYNLHVYLKRGEMKFVSSRERYVNYKSGEMALIELDDQENEGSFEQLAYKAFKEALPKDYPEILKTCYVHNTGKTLHLDKPGTFNEKIQWLKIYDSTPQKTELADKYLARKWISHKIGDQYLVPLLGVWDSYDEIPFFDLPESFVLKCNHGSGWNLIVEDKKAINHNKAKCSFDKWMSLNYAFLWGEFHYRDIPRKILAEKYLNTTEGIKDYRFYCFDGKPVHVWVDMFSGTPNHIRSIFNMDWEKLNIRCGWPDGGERLSRRPKNFEKMKELAMVLSEGFSFVRVDFFEIEEKIYMGEMTFAPMSGFGAFDPPEWDEKMGDYLVLPIKREMSRDTIDRTRII